MKQKKYTKMFAGSLALAFGATAMFAQDSEATLESETTVSTDASIESSSDSGSSVSSDTTAESSTEATVEVNEDTALHAILRPSDRLIARATANIDRLSAEVQADVVLLQESVAELRVTWEEEYKPDADATLEEIAAAREQFRADLAAEIETNRELRKQVVTELRNDIRAQLRGQEWNEEARALFQEYKAIKLELNAAWRAALGELGGDATREEVAAAKELFLESNQELVAAQIELAAELRAMIRANIDVDRPTVDRDPLPEALQTLRADIQLARSELRDQKRQLRSEWLDLGPEEREQRRTEIIEDLRAAHDEIKDTRRQLIEDLRGEVGGDRRPEG